MNSAKLEYSFSDGKYWSKYAHCRVWENGTYNVIVRDNYGQTASRQIEVLNNHHKILNPPTITSSYIDGEWSSTDVTYTVKAENSAYDIYKVINGSAQKVGTGTYIETLNSTKTDIEYYCMDQYGNKSTSTTFNCLIDKSAPTNISYAPTINMAQRIYTVMIAIDNESPMKYSISYDNGSTWSTPQYGRIFESEKNTPAGTYIIKGRVYNAAGLYIEGSAVTVTIN